MTSAADFQRGVSEIARVSGMSASDMAEKLNTAAQLGRNVTAEAVDPAERFALYRLCDCTTCEGTGKVQDAFPAGTVPRCQDCRGEGRTRDLLATCASPEAFGVALYTLALEGEIDGCPIGWLDRIPDMQETVEPKAWLVRPWLPSARNVSDAGRTLANAKKDPKTKLGTESEARGLLPRRKK